MKKNKILIKRRSIRNVINIVFVCFLITVAVRTKGGQRCCGGEDAPDQTEIFEVVNDRVYYSGENDTLEVRFRYKLFEDQVGSFNYLLIFFYGVGWEKWPSREFTSDDSIIIPSSYYQFDDTWDTLYFTGLADQDNYEIYICIEGCQDTSMLPEVYGFPIASKAGDSLTHIYGPGGRQLVLLMGNRRICNCADTLHDPYAYPLLIQVVDENGAGINGDTVFFKANWGTFGNYSEIGFITNTITYADSTFDGVAGPVGNYPYLFPATPHDDIVIIIQGYTQAYQDTFWATKKVALHCINDDGTSHLQPPYCHETTDSINKDVEIPGDGYDNWGSRKTIKIEIDYNYTISKSKVEDAISEFYKIIATAGLDTSLIDIVIDDVIYLLSAIDVDSLKTYLTQHRDYNFWKNGYIHMIIGTTDRDNCLVAGKTVTYAAPEFGGFSIAQCAHLASTDSSISQYFLDSTGVIIYAGAINSALSLTQDPDTSWNINRALAVSMAHEIGHSLGLVFHHGEGCMDSTVNYQLHYNNYNYFDTFSLNLAPPFDAMNTRDVLGIHTIDIGW